jgi:AAHS family 4-hydroxybenzoate transporter-like MFS transporter
VPLLMFFVPESLKFRAERDPKNPAIARTLRRMDPDLVLRGDEAFVLGEGSEKGRKAKLTDIFTEGRGWMTAVLWAACMMSMTNIALMGSWLPTFFQEMAGIPIQEFAISAMIAYLGGIAGTLSIGWLMDRFSATWLIPLYYIGLAGALLGMAWVPFEAGFFILILIVWNFVQTGGQAGLNTLITQVYPPRMKSTALGWAGGAGRIGGVVAPLYGALALAEHYSLQLTLGLAALLPLTVAVLISFLGIASAKRHPEAPAQPAAA